VRAGVQPHGQHERPRQEDTSKKQSVKPRGKRGSVFTASANGNGKMHGFTVLGRRIRAHNVSTIYDTS
jgi:hypothetical protein